jgi:polyhydroxyalkanoate synthase
MAQYDHIVPPECGKPLMDHVGSNDKEEILLPGGHVSLVAGGNAIKRMWPKLNQWLERRST